MKRILLFFSAIIISASAFCQSTTQAPTPTQTGTQAQTLSDKDLATYIWALSKTYPDGFTFDLNPKCNITPFINLEQ